MSREIKFNAFDSIENDYIRYNEWIEKEDIEIDGEYVTKNEALSRFLEFHYGCDLLQYTGLKDKNGVEIYEGDIVKDLRSLFKDNRANCRVFYQEDRGRYVFGGWEIPAGMMHTFEVIGNIYENPELLEVN